MKDITVFLTEQFEAAAASVNEDGKVKSEKDFREFAEKMAKEAFGDKFDEDKFKETVDKFLDDNKDLVDDDKWAEVVGKWEEGFTKED
jgi:hypothetical protein